jgi:hypothetical protein
MKTLFVSAVSILLLGMAPCVRGNGTINTIAYNVDGVTPLPHVHILTYDSLNSLIADDVSNDSGRYTLSVPPGVFHEHFSKIGFVDKDTNNIVVAEDETTQVEVNMCILGCCHYVVGDVNGSGNLTGLDVTYAVRYFKGGYPPPYRIICPCGEYSWYGSGDVNGSCTFDGLDVLYMVRYFKGGSPPMPCPGCAPVDLKE